jgi:magnesium-protoporphyrin IX monomethyl ester (oxidative) cyclase
MYLVGGTKFRSRTAEHVVAEIEHLYTTHGVTHFSFMDDNVSLNKKRTIEICAGIVRRDLRIQFETPNGLYVNSLDPHVIDALASAGWVRGALAIESGSDYIRNTIMKKNLSEEKIHAVVSHLRKHPQVYTKAYFIIGMPEDTAQTLENTYAMIESLDIDEPTVTNVVPFPGTELFKQCLDDGLLIDNLEVRNLWRDESFFLTNNDRFFLKPYRLSIEELQDYRKKLDQLLTRKIACAKTRRSSHA